MLIIKQISIFSLFMFGSTNLLLAQKDLKLELGKIQSELQQSNKMHLDFKQTIYTALRKKKRVSEGFAYFQKPAQFRWAIDTPMARHLIYNGQKFAEINPKAKTGTIYPDSSGKLKQYAELVSIVMDIEKLMDRFTVEEISNAGKNTNIKLHPKTNDGIETVDLKVDNTQKFISEVKLTYVGGNYWQVSFSNPRRDKLPDDAFTIPSDKSYNLQTLQ